MKANGFIFHLLSNTTLNKERVIEFVNNFTDGFVEETMRIMAYLTDFEDKPVVAETSDKIGKEQATFVSYNFFNNEVTYRYIENRKFNVPTEKVEEVADKVFDSYDNIPREIRWNDNGEDKVSVDIKYWRIVSCDLSNWQD